MHDDIRPNVRNGVTDRRFIKQVESDAIFTDRLPASARPNDDSILRTKRIAQSTTNEPARAGHHNPSARYFELMMA